MVDDPKTPVGPVFIDTNVLIYAQLGHSSLHEVAVERVTQLFLEGIDLWISRQVLREYLAAMTRQAQLTDTPPIASLTDDTKRFEEQFLIAEDGSRVTDQLYELVNQTVVGGKQIHDANIVATMLAHNIPAILTHNVSDFARFDKWIQVLPLMKDVE